VLKQELLREIPELKKFVSLFSGYGKAMFTLFLTIGTVTELLKSLSGKGDVGGKLTMSLIIAASLSAFNAYQSDFIGLGFSMSEEILKIGKVHNTVDFIFDNFSSKGNQKIESSPKSATVTNKDGKVIKWNQLNVSEVTIISKNNLNIAKSLFNSIPLALTWLLSKSIIVLNRSIYSILYNLFIVIGPLVAWLALITGWESSIKAFWQTFMFFVIAPIVFSLTYVISFYVIFAPSAAEPLPVDTLINTIVCAIMLLGSFVTTAYIVTSKPIASFAEQASMMGAMALATGGVVAAKTSISNVSTKGLGLAKSGIDSHINPRVAKMLRTSDPANKKFQIPGSRIDDVSRHPTNVSRPQVNASSESKKVNTTSFVQSRGQNISSKTKETSNNIGSAPLQSKGRSVGSAVRTLSESIAEKRKIKNLAKERAIRISNSKFLARPSNIRTISDAGKRVGKIKTSFSKDPRFAMETPNDMKPKTSSYQAQTKNNKTPKNIRTKDVGNEKSV
jgi:hypothetical protein